MPSILITGVSSGPGRALGLLAAQEGWSVTGTVPDLARESAAGWPPSVRLRLLDLSEPDTLDELVRDMMAAEGAPDVLVNNSDMLQFGSVEDTPQFLMRQVFEVNVFGQIALVRRFMPAMRRRGSGVVVNVCSLGGRLALPFFGTYTASKFALEGYSEALWHELRPFGIRVKVVEIGYTAAPIHEKDRSGLAEEKGVSSPYEARKRAMARAQQRLLKRTSPEDTAFEMWRALRDPSDRLRYPIAGPARRLLWARRLLGDHLMMRLAFRCPRAVLR